MKHLLKTIHDNYTRYYEATRRLELELEPYLVEYLDGEISSVIIAEDEANRLFLVNPVNNLRYYLDEEHIAYIKKHRKLDESVWKC